MEQAGFRPRLFEQAKGTTEMGNITKAERERRALEAEQSGQEQEAVTDEVEQQEEVAEAEQSSPVDADESHLIAVFKNGETLNVHPCALKQHINLGWKVI